MTNKAYDTIKTISLLAAPILTFLAALVAIWDLPFSSELTATLAAIDALLGGVVVVAKSLYEKKEAEK